MNKFNIPIDSSSFVTEKIVLFKGKEYCVDSVSSLTYEDSKFSMNFVTAHRVRALLIIFNDGRWVRLMCHSPIIKKTKFKNIFNAFNSLSAVTFRQRYKRYVSYLESVGFFDYFNVRIYSDGTISTIQNPQVKLSLRDTHSEGRLGMGKSYGLTWIGYSESDPNSIGIYEKSHAGIFTQNTCVQFKCQENRDVIMVLLRRKFRTFP
jgi:hypothetical protein